MSLSLHRSHSFSSSAGKLHYLSYEPPGWGEELRPLVLFLHGAAQRGDDLEQVASVGIPLEIERGHNYPFVAISPQCPPDTSWDSFTSALSELLDEVIPKYKIDPRRVYLTGISMGGFGAWKLAASEPHRFAALVAICGGGNPAAAQALRALPTWAFHGQNDPVVPASKTQEMVQALEAVGAPIKVTIYPGAGHEIWDQTYKNAEVFEWLLGQRRGSPDAKELVNESDSPTARTGT
jgi:predicted peptidase